jgi:hypothetical protein
MALGDASLQKSFKAAGLQIHAYLHEILKYILK